MPLKPSPECWHFISGINTALVYLQVRVIKAYLLVLSLFCCLWETLQSNRQKNENFWEGAPLKRGFNVMQNMDEDLILNASLLSTKTLQPNKNMTKNRALQTLNWTVESIYNTTRMVMSTLVASVWLGVPLKQRMTP